MQGVPADVENFPVFAAPPIDRERNKLAPYGAQTVFLSLSLCSQKLENSPMSANTPCTRHPSHREVEKKKMRGRDGGCASA